MGISNYDKAKELWDSFCHEVRYNQRFFISHSLLDKLVPIVKRCEESNTPGHVYYRARIIDEKAARYEHMVSICYRPDASEEERKWYRHKDNKFRGLSKEGSYVPPDPDQIMDGRSNPKFIRYLYVSENPTTAIFEVRPILFNRINVSGIKVNEHLKVANITANIDMDSNVEKSYEEWLLSFIQSAFSTPTNNSDNYITSQVIAEYFRNLGYDGIKYGSSLHSGGYNLTIFDVSKCEAIFSTDLKLDNMKISLVPAFGANNIDGRFEYIVDNIPMRLDSKSHGLVEATI